MRYLFKFSSGLLFSAIAAQAWAGADCPQAPRDQWMSVFELQKKIINDYGFAIKKFKIEDNCYEIYGWEPAGDGGKDQRIEVYFDPVSGEIVKKEID